MLRLASEGLSSIEEVLDRAAGSLSTSKPASSRRLIPSINNSNFSDTVRIAARGVAPISIEHGALAVVTLLERWRRWRKRQPRFRDRVSADMPPSYPWWTSRHIADFPPNSKAKGR